MKKLILVFVHMLENIVHVWHFHVRKQWRL